MKALVNYYHHQPRNQLSHVGRESRNDTRTPVRLMTRSSSDSLALRRVDEFWPQANKGQGPHLTPAGGAPGHNSGKRRFCASCGAASGEAMRMATGELPRILAQAAPCVRCSRQAGPTIDLAGAVRADSRSCQTSGLRAATTRALRNGESVAPPARSAPQTPARLHGLLRWRTLRRGHWRAQNSRNRGGRLLV